MHYSRFRTHGDPGEASRRKRLDGEGTISVHRGYRYIVTYRDGRRVSKQAEHRLVMEHILGRALFPDETVHHRNGVRSDNEPSNLELWSSWQPAGQRVEDKITWARQILDRYEAA
jgi:hypothetical protein